MRHDPDLVYFAQGPVASPLVANPVRRLDIVTVERVAAARNGHYLIHFETPRVTGRQPIINRAPAYRARPPLRFEPLDKHRSPVSILAPDVLCHRAPPVPKPRQKKKQDAGFKATSSHPSRMHPAKRLRRHIPGRSAPPPWFWAYPLANSRRSISIPHPLVFQQLSLAIISYQLFRHHNQRTSARSFSALPNSRAAAKPILSTHERASMRRR